MRALGLFLFIIIVCAAFAAGFLVRGQTSLLTSLGFSSMAVTGTEEDEPSVVSDDTSEALTPRVEEIESILVGESLDSFNLQDATSALLNSIVDSSNDPNMMYFDEERYKNMMADSNSDYSGVGVLFSEHDGRAYAVEVFEGSQAQAAGVEQGDFVESIDGDIDHDWTLAEVLSAIQKHAGKDISITWRHADNLDDNGGEQYTISLLCSNDTEKNVKTEMKDDVGYIQLKQITQNSDELVENAVNKLEDKGAHALVLDLRNNPGGYLTQSVDIASLFVKSGTLVKIETNASEETTKAASGDVITDLPLVVIVNGQTAAAAEVLAAALQDNQRATLVGETTLGKGSVQVTRELSFGGALRYTAAYYKSPDGHEIDGVGVTPDIELERSKPGDNQKDTAIDTAQSLE